MELAAGIYTFEQVLEQAGLNVDQSFDRRRVRVGGLSFDDTSEQFRVPETAETLEVTLDGEAHTTFTVK